MSGHAPSAPSAAPPPTIALLDWSHLIEDFLDHLGVSLETFRDEFRGSWMFGYIDALRVAGVRTVLVCVSGRVQAPWRFTHGPTGAPVTVLPAPAAYRAIRRRVPNPYAATIEGAVGDVRGLRRAVLAALKEVAPYVALPVARLASELRRQRCVAVLCQDYEHPRFDVCTLLARVLRLPVFACFQGGDAPLSPLERPLRRLTMRAAAGLVIGAETEMHRVRARYGIPASRLARIFNPIDVRAWRAADRGAARAELGIPPTARVVAWHGRVLVHRKGLDVLLDAWETLLARQPGRPLRLLLVGTGNDAAELRARLARLRSPATVRWVDQFVHGAGAITRYLSAADVYVLPSRHEGFPVAVIEAMSCGLAIVATDAPGVSDILPDGHASGGQIVPRGDAGALAAALAGVLEPDVSRRLGERARQRAEACFSLEAVGRQLRAFIVDGGAR